MKIINWIITSAATLLTMFGAFLFGVTIWLVVKTDDSYDFLPVIPLGLGIILLGLLLFMRARLERDTQHLLFKVFLQGVVGAGLIFFWWVLIERPKITHEDIKIACRLVSPQDQEEQKQCYYGILLKSVQQ